MLCCALHEQKRRVKNTLKQHVEGETEQKHTFALATHIFRKHSTNAVPGSAYEGKKDDVCMRACSKEKLAKQI